MLTVGRKARLLRVGRSNLATTAPMDQEEGTAWGEGSEGLLGLQGRKKKSPLLYFVGSPDSSCGSAHKEALSASSQLHVSSDTSDTWGRSNS